MGTRTENAARQGQHTGTSPAGAGLPPATIIFRVSAVAGSDIVAQHAARSDQSFLLVPDRCPDHADAILHHHRNLQPVEAGIIGRIAVVKLANGFDGNAGILKAVAPASRGSGVGRGVVPVSGLVDIATACQRRPRRNTDWRRCIGVGEPHRPSGKGIEIRG